MVEADEGTAQGQERLMDLRPSLVPDRQSPIPMEPRQGPLDHPAVPAQPLAGLDALARDPDRDPAAVQEPAAAGHVIGFVGMELGRALAPLAGGLFAGWNRVDQLRKHHAVVTVGARQPGGQRDAPTVADHMVFRAWFAAIGGIGTNRRAPFWPGHSRCPDWRGPKRSGQRADVLQALRSGTTPEIAAEAVGSPQTSETAPQGFWRDRVRRFWGG